MEKEEELKQYHFSYCNKSNIAVDSEEARNYIQDKIDLSADCVDECMLLIEENEFNQEEDEKNIKVGKVRIFHCR